jgi:Histidine kinase-, DNA gyrase B-, and HSP90-like ATPase
MLIGESLKTKFASPERLAQNIVLKQHEKILTDANLSLLYDFTTDFIVVLNTHRQIIFANKTLLDFLEVSDAKEIIGQRPGEMLNCNGAISETGGCGTSLKCSVCGAVKAILACNRNCTQIEECCIQTKDSKASYNFRIWVALPWEDKDYVLLIIRDIADEKFRNALEQTFFHDLTNTACDIQGLLSLINSPESYKKYLPMLSNISKELLEEINGQRDLRYAEEGTILIHKSPIKTLDLIKEFVDIYKNQKITENIELVISDESEDITFQSDERLLMRVIENMIKNAIEASGKGQTVTVSCKKDKNNVIFSVHNPTSISRKVQLDLFKRSFSTKSAGRGWGTYSMKLLTENYLNGKIEFNSTEEDGTTFYAKYPLK